MTTYTMSDAAYFSQGMLGSDAVAGYFGGPLAVRAWTLREWQEAGRKPKLPIWVPRSQATGANADADVLDILGCLLDYVVPRGQTVAFDLETSQADVSYMTRMAACLQFFGYGTLVYGSLSAIPGDAPGYLWRWDADWTGEAHLTPGMQATQWTSGTSYDQSEISEALYETLLWR